MANFESEDSRLKKCCPYWTIEKSVLVIGCLGFFCTFSEVIVFFYQTNVPVTILSLISYIALVIAVLKKMPYLFFFFLIFNLFEILFYVPAFFYLLFAIVSRDEKIQVKACLFLERLIGSEMELNKQAPYAETVFYAVLVLVAVLADVVEQWVVWKAFKNAKSKQEARFSLPITSLRFSSTSRACDDDERPLAV